MNFSPTQEPSQAFATLLTPRGRGAVATVRFEGDCRLIDVAQPSLFQAANRKPLAEQPVNRIVFGRWGRDAAEDVVVCRTDEQVLEIHCHGGEAAVGRILDDLQKSGCEVQSWREAGVRTFGLFEQEMREALTRSRTLRTAQILLKQQSGVLRSALEELQSLTVAEENRQEVLSRLDALLAWADFGKHLTHPWNVVLAGRPNVGKSSLINALVGYTRSIVFDQPGTTRDVVTAETAYEGWLLQFADTAGLREDADRLESAGVSLARRRLTEADCRVILLDVSQPAQKDDRRLLEHCSDAIIVAHKCDLPNQWGEEVPGEALSVSSVNGKGVERLLETIVRRLIPEVPMEDTPIPVSERQVELLQEAREAVIREEWERLDSLLAECLR